ncbi:LEAF RUST 10 DISEASE-RESISTANCE LOCUS RECEPTOR-LIKE PROTEIN KINASE-like 2.1 isoform X2 [Arachis stenosperma]|uniref:LEAF RUST 10 DISEASE-RESISTANCE LOCUS RECEPTOR-LIKE PROTEIN KINASE-like 2.1 isoform X2 n=1 Tax=Arachis stenosperma TaxID=217475 RepID=UPI0025ABB795|nr:LEAF RUST 10 DISEASE-RESISTANCE LOCUS RECEPTOR-LIKE PROTEIN KINASE-like 2.1 isoform X2 [Arachis stenosperma]
MPQVPHSQPSPEFHNYRVCPEYNIYYGPPTEEIPKGFQWPTNLTECSNIQLPLKDESDTSHPFPFVSDEMQLEVLLSDDWAKRVKHQRGQCQLDTQGKFYCAGSSSSTNRLVKKMGLALALAVTATLVLVIITLYYKRWKKQNQTLPLVDAFFERHDHLQIKRYSYSEMKKVTNSFKNKLGQGGFGSVYKGQLQDGRHVAVKILSEFKGDGQEFINEVASMSRTSHVNIVALLGFCFEGSKRALVYELMPNGSLEKLIYNENSVIGDRQLDCQTLYDIAIGVARGLEYLHKGCNTKILHFDIKPHNILLDKKFCPKISDFGLAKVCTRKESIVSIFGARGTAGYIAPEVFSRNFGAVSHKSDVYSYGMMVLEMVGRRKNIKAEVDVSSEIYFPHWIYNRLVSNQELDLQNIRNECDNEMVRKMTIVSLWCIQTNPSTRPSISKVVEMLEGSAELLQLPPKPYWFSPSNSP